MNVSRTPCPCRDCDQRHEYCHSGCSLYKDWKDDLEKQKKVRQDAEHRNAEHIDYVRQSYSRMLTRGANIRRENKDKGIRRTT